MLDHLENKLLLNDMICVKNMATSNLFCIKKNLISTFIFN